MTGPMNIPLFWPRASTAMPIPATCALPSQYYATAMKRTHTGVGTDVI